MPSLIIGTWIEVVFAVVATLALMAIAASINFGGATLFVFLFTFVYLPWFRRRRYREKVAILLETKRREEEEEELRASGHPEQVHQPAFFAALFRFTQMSCLACLSPFRRPLAPVGRARA